MNIVLCGMMGAGKTVVGKMLANTLGWRWVDTDEMITAQYGAIPEIFERQGETCFRDLETQTVKTLTQKDRLVISTGGGIVLREENITLLKENGIIIYLRAQKETLVKRLQGDENRPLLKTDNVNEKIDELLQARERIYEGVADVVVDTDEKTPKAIAEEILARIEIK